MTTSMPIVLSWLAIISPNIRSLSLSFLFGRDRCSVLSMVETVKLHFLLFYFIHIYILAVRLLDDDIGLYLLPEQL